MQIEACSMAADVHNRPWILNLQMNDEWTLMCLQKRVEQMVFGARVFYKSYPSHFPATLSIVILPAQTQCAIVSPPTTNQQTKTFADFLSSPLAPPAPPCPATSVLLCWRDGSGQEEMDKVVSLKKL